MMPYSGFGALMTPPNMWTFISKYGSITAVRSKLDIKSMVVL